MTGTDTRADANPQGEGAPAENDATKDGCPARSVGEEHHVPTGGLEPSGELGASKVHAPHGSGQ